MTFSKYLSPLLLLLLSVTVLAQAIECPALENAAMTEAGLWCAAVQPGQVCYGNSSVKVEFRSSSQEFVAPGNRVSLADIASLTTASGDNLWGVAYAEVEAYPVDGWKPASAALIALGDTTLVDTGTERITPDVITLEITEVDGANVRSNANTGAGVVGAVRKGDLVKVTGRLADSSWLRIQTPDGITGWVSAVTLTDDVSGVPIITRDSTAPEMFLRPFASFNFESGVDDARCAAVPDSGVVLQSPGDNVYRFRVNGVYIELGGTLFLQSQPDTFFTVRVLEGEARLSVGSRSATIEQGFESIMVMTSSDDGTPNPGVPGLPAPYQHGRLLPLPMRLLPRLAYVVFDLRSIIKVRPSTGESPLAGVLVSDACVVTVGTDDVNLRSGAGTDFPIRGVINTRESALPIGRAVGTDGNNWWQLSQDVWISGTVTVTGGNCAAVPIVEPPVLPPPTTPQP